MAIDKSSGRSAVAASAYRSASKKMVKNVLDGETGIAAEQVWDYSQQCSVRFSLHIMFQSGCLIKKNSVIINISKLEKRKDGRYVREFDIALSVELSDEQNI